MKYYELMYIIPAKYTEEEIAPINEKIIKLIRDGGGEIVLNQNWGKIKLSYPIKQTSQGSSLVLEFDAPAHLIKKIDTEIKLMPEILRHIITSKKKMGKEEIEKEKAFQEKILKRKVEAAKTEKEKEAKPVSRKKVDLEELDKKLDEILEGKIE